MGRSGVKALPSPRSFKPFWSSDDKIDTTRGKRRRELPQNRQETSSGVSAAADGGSPFGVCIVSNRHDAPPKWAPPCRPLFSAALAPENVSWRFRGKPSPLFPLVVSVSSSGVQKGLNERGEGRAWTPPRPWCRDYSRSFLGQN